MGVGSHTTGEGLLAGENNSANNTTSIIADAQSHPEHGNVKWNINDHAILLATATGNVGNRPSVALDGVVGQANLGGAGVRGLGSQRFGRRGRLTGREREAMALSVMGDR
jgi:hypothetical protein